MKLIITDIEDFYLKAEGELISGDATITELALKGGYLMEYKITKKESFTVLAGALCFGKRENGLRHVWNQY